MTAAPTLVTLPRVVVAAPASGHGKTMVTTGLLAALHARGVEASGHKVGPDYIDPGYHAAATGRVGRNLDPWLQGEERIVPLLLHGASSPRPADVAVIEGVMGLFDGAIGSGGFASTAHVARLTRTPVVLVVDAASTSRSVGATVLGFATYDPSVRVAGVILNNVATARHEAEARDGIAMTGVPVLGVVPRTPDVVVPSRHLGLVPVAERSPEALEAVAALATLVGGHVDLDAVLELARTAPPLAGPAWSAAEAVATARSAAEATPPTARVRVAVAGGPAFSFLYAETVELLEAAGAEVVTVDPLRDDRLPEGTRGLYVGGGFPEVHAPALAANTSLRESVCRLVAEGGVVVGECAGLLWLGAELDGHPMCGVLPTTARFGTRLHLGYREGVALVDSVLARAGERVTGHEFHRTTVDLGPVADQPGAEPAWAWRAHDGSAHRDGVVTSPAATPAERGPGGHVHASYLHTHWAGHPHLATRFVDAARASARRPGPGPESTAEADPDGCLVIGVGASRRASADDVVAAVRAAVPALPPGRSSPPASPHTGPPAGPGARLVTAYGVGGDGVLDAAAARLGLPLERLTDATLSAMPVPTPSARVAAHRGTASVAEAAVLAVGADLTRPKQSHGLVTVALGTTPTRLTATPRGAIA